MSLADDLQAQLRADWARERVPAAGPPYLVLPSWLVFREGWEVFCGQFERSNARTGLSVRGFETTGHDGQVLRYTLKRYTETLTPEDSEREGTPQ